MKIYCRPILLLVVLLISFGCLTPATYIGLSPTPPPPTAPLPTATLQPTNWHYAGTAIGLCEANAGKGEPVDNYTLVLNENNGETLIVSIEENRITGRKQAIIKGNAENKLVGQVAQQNEGWLWRRVNEQGQVERLWLGLCGDKIQPVHSTE